MTIVNDNRKLSLYYKIVNDTSRSVSDAYKSVVDGYRVLLQIVASLLRSI